MTNKEVKFHVDSSFYSGKSMLVQMANTEYGITFENDTVTINVQTMNNKLKELSTQVTEMKSINDNKSIDEASICLYRILALYIIGTRIQLHDDEIVTKQQGLEEQLNQLKREKDIIQSSLLNANAKLQQETNQKSNLEKELKEALKNLENERNELGKKVKDNEDALKKYKDALAALSESMISLAKNK